MWTQSANGANKKLVLHVQLRCGSLSITTSVSHLANEFDVWSEFHGQVSLAAVNQILWCSWGYERLQNSKDSLKACFENVNIIFYTPHQVVKGFGSCNVFRSSRLIVVYQHIWQFLHQLPWRCKLFFIFCRKLTDWFKDLLYWGMLKKNW